MLTNIVDHLFISNIRDSIITKRNFSNVTTNIFFGDIRKNYVAEITQTLVVLKRFWFQKLRRASAQLRGLSE